MRERGGDRGERKTWGEGGRESEEGDSATEGRERHGEREVERVRRETVRQRGEKDMGRGR